MLVPKRKSFRLLLPNVPARNWRTLYAACQQSLRQMLAHTGQVIRVVGWRGQAFGQIFLLPDI